MNDKVYIGILGNPIEASKQVMDMFNNSKTFMNMAPLLRNTTQIYEFTGTEDIVKYEMILMTTENGREMDIIDFLNNMIEDNLMNSDSWGNVGMEEMIDNIEGLISNIFGYSIKDTPGYDNLLKEIAGTVISKTEILSKYSDDEGYPDMRTLNLVYRNNKHRLDSVKMYGKLFEFLKTAINFAIRQSLSKGDTKSKSHRGKITIEGTFGNLNEFMKFYSNSIVNAPLIAELMDMVTVSVPVKELREEYKNICNSDASIVLPNLTPNSLRYLEVLSGLDYIMYIDSISRYEEDKENIEQSVNKLKSLVNPEIVEVVLTGKRDDGSDELATGLENTDKVDTLVTFLGTLDNSQWDDKGVVREVSDNTESRLDIYQRIEDGQISIANSIRDIGTDGHNPVKRKIRSWGDLTDNIDIVETEDFNYIQESPESTKFVIIDDLNIFETIPLEDMREYIDGNFKQGTFGLKDGSMTLEDFTATIDDVALVIESLQNKLLKYADSEDDFTLNKLYYSLLLGDLPTEITSVMVEKLSTMNFGDLYEGEESLINYAKTIIKRNVTEGILKEVKKASEIFKNRLVRNDKIKYSREQFQDVAKEFLYY